MKKLFWAFVAAEVVTAGIIGWKIAHAQHHPWAVKPRLPSPRQRNPAAISTGHHRPLRPRLGKEPAQ